MSTKSISISASGVKDYIECPLRWWFRRNLSGEGEKSPELIVGLTVHDAIHKHWDNENLALAYSMKEVKDMRPADVLKTQKMVKSFFTNFKYYLSSRDTSEHSFSIPLPGYKDVLVRGRFDRISKHGQIFDWKTTAKPPKNIDNDVQFIIYHWAYRKLYNKTPSGVYYAALSEGKLITFNYDKNLESVLFDNVIPEMIKAIKAERFPALGFFNDKCYWCQFRSDCHKEFGVGKENNDELVRSIFS
jgi:RecB family exonuclease